MKTTLARHLEKLSVEIDARPIGSLANQRAADYIRDCFVDLGLEVEEQDYACTAWDCDEAFLSIEGDVLPVEANAFSPACDVTAPVVPVATLDALIDADLAGKIALFHGDLISEPLSPKSWFLKSVRDDAIIDALETKDPAALLTPPPPMPQYEQFTGDWALEVPAATVSGGVAERLLRDADVAHLRLICRKYPATARNIVARRRGVGPASDPLDKVVLMAHFDTRINTPGALDNGGGVAALLCLAEALVEERSPFDLEFVAFNGEEYLPMGDDEYVRRAGEAAFERIRLAVNMDGIGLREGQNTITQFNVPPAMLERLKKITQCYPAVAWVEPWPESNHSTFAFRGVPSVALSSQGARNVSHYRTDTMDKVDTQKLVEIVKLVQEAVRTAD